MNQPHFHSEFLQSVTIAFRKRRKALSHRASSADLAKVQELVAGEKTERLEIHLPKYSNVLLRMHAWPDKMIWLDARQSSKAGWVWSWTLTGRLLGSYEAPEVIGVLEDTFGLLFEMNASRVKELSALWDRLLAQGPKEII